MAAQRSCFIKQGRPAVAFHTIVRRRTRCIPTSDQALCPVGIFRGKAVSKADSAPPMSHPMQQEKVLPAVQKHRIHATKRRRMTSCVELIHPFRSVGSGASASIHARQFRCFALIESSPVPHGRRIREAWIKSDLCVHIFHLYAIKGSLAHFCYLHIYFIPNFAPPAIVTVSSTSRKFYCDSHFSYSLYHLQS